MPQLRVQCYHGELAPPDGDAIAVVLDVIRATTCAVTAADLGISCIPVASLAEANAVRAARPDALLVGEQGGVVPDGFHLNNSPVAIASQAGDSRPLILLSSSGSRLMRAAADRYATVSVASLRNWRATASAVMGDRDVTVIGAGTLGQFRAEDRLAAGWIGGALLDAGFEAGADAARHVERWRTAPLRAIAEGRSAAYLRSSGQDHDLEFVLEHVDDIDRAFWMIDGTVRTAPQLVGAAVA